jgi:hypothetical protein
MEIIDVDKGHRLHQWIWCIGSAIEDDWRAEASEEEVRTVVISHFQQERLWKMGGDDMEKAQEPRMY